MKEKIVLGIVGVGHHMMRAHIQHLLLMPNVTIARWFDPGVESVGCFNGLDSRPIRSTFEALIADEAIDAVFIGSPDQYHTEQLSACVHAGKHVFCEKPMAVTPEDAHLLRVTFEIAKLKGLVISSCHPRRFDPPFTWLKAMLETDGWVTETFGTITDFVFDIWYHEVTGEWKKDRSFLKDHFGHEIDLYRFLFGGPQGLSAKRTFDAYDKYQVIGKSLDEAFPNFCFTGYRSLKESVYQETVTLKGTKNALVLQLNSGKGFWMKDGAAELFPAIDYEERFRVVNENFVNAVLGKTESYLTRKDMIVNNLSSVELCATDGYVPIM